MGHWKQFMESEHLGSWDLVYPDGPKKGQPADFIGAIVKVVQGAVGAKKQKKPLIYLENAPGGKAFVGNATNCKTIAKVVGSDDVKDWVGHVIAIYPATTEMAGETVPCIRVRNRAPQQKQAAAEKPEPQKVP